MSTCDHINLGTGNSTIITLPPGCKTLRDFQAYDSYIIYQTFWKSLLHNKGHAKSGHFTYRYLHCVASKLSDLLAESQTIHVYADLPGMFATVSPQATIPPSLIVTPYRPNIAIHNESSNMVALLKPTCSLATFGTCKRLEAEQTRLLTDLIQTRQITV